MGNEVKPFIGREALYEGLVTPHQLRTQHRLLYPDIYLPGSIPPTLWQRTYGAWLYSHRQGVVAGLAAAALHGSEWVADNVPVDMVWSQFRAPSGLRTTDPRLPRDEFQVLEGMRVTTPARTAFDLGRLVLGATKRKPTGQKSEARRKALARNKAVAQLDALAAATGITVEQVRSLAQRHRGARGSSDLRQVLSLVDAGAESPQETRVRLLLIEAGLPRPRTQIPVFDPAERCWYYLDMGWEDVKAGVEYEGDYHRTDRERYVKDIRKRDALTRLGWRVVWVLEEDSNDDIVRRAHAVRETAHGAGSG